MSYSPGNNFKRENAKYERPKRTISQNDINLYLEDKNSSNSPPWSNQNNMIKSHAPTSQRVNYSAPGSPQLFQHFKNKRALSNNEIESDDGEDDSSDNDVEVNPYNIE